MNEPSIFDYYAHGGLLIVYFAIMLRAADTARHIKRARDAAIRRQIRTFVLMVALLAGTYVVIQGGWVLFDGFDFWPEPLDLAWLLFDAANAVAYAAFLGAVRVYLLWCTDSCATCEKRHQCPRFGEQPR